MMDIDPSSIESRRHEGCHFLAAYGSQAANGVIMITSRRAEGQADDQLQRLCCP